VLLATVLVLVAVVAFVLLSRGSSTTTAACLGATPGVRGVRDSSLRKALRDTPAPIEVLHYKAVDAYGKSIEIVLARASDEPAATRIVKRVSPINAVATRRGRVAILSAKPLDPDVTAKIADCLAKSSWS
jgi:aspartokinase